MTRSISAPLALVQPDLAGPNTAGIAGYPEAIEGAGFELVHLDWRGSPDDRARLTDFDARLHPERPAAIFVSIGAAQFIRRSCPRLSRHLSFRPESLRHHAWSTLVPLDIQLNRSFVLLPFGHLEAHRGALQALFGDRLFLRPDSACKTFPGQCIDTRDLADLASELRQIYAIRPEELVVVDRHRVIDPVEYRTWIARGEVITSAGYAFGPGGCPEGMTIPPCPPAILDLARDLMRRAPYLESIDELLVADFSLESGDPRLVEVNAWSTSGFYPGADLGALALASIAGT